MQKTNGIYRDRLDRYLSSVLFSDVNLWSQRIKHSHSGEPRIKLYSVPEIQGKPSAHKVLSILSSKEDCLFKECQVGASIGPAWSTHWFHLKVTAPEEMIGQRVWLRWEMGCESLLYDMSGNPITGFSDDRCEYLLTEVTENDRDFEFLIEAACLGLFGNGNGGMINAPDHGRTFQLKRVELRVYNDFAMQLYADLCILKDMTDHLGGTARGAQALHVANEAINACNLSLAGKDGLQDALEITRGFLASCNGKSAHEVYAVGHCHIDTAWLWDYGETRRKTARSWASQLEFMDRHDDEFKFVCSQMQQLAWLQKDYPPLFARIQAHVKTGQFIPIGGSWVEMDANMPCGESFIRQFLYGQSFCKENFGLMSEIFWLPDTFGYAAQLPQMMRHCGFKYFFTTKIAWNNVNKFPHNSFWWQGLDGSRVLAHFPPRATYTAETKVLDLVECVREHKDKDRSPRSLLVYGRGDGGGGPTLEMLQSLKLLRDVEGLHARVQHQDPVEFYRKLESEDGPHLLTWNGELYLEFHRGTFTSQAKTKYYNRKCEVMLRTADMLHSLVSIKQSSKFKSYSSVLREAWKKVLLNQFHDVLPGSSIGRVYEDALELYRQVEKSVAQVIDECLEVVADSMVDFIDLSGNTNGSKGCILVFNPLPYECTRLIPYQNLVVRDIAPFSFKLLSPAENSDGSSVNGLAEFVELNKRDDGGLYMRNEWMTASFDISGRLQSLLHGGKECLSGVVELKMFEDIPVFWDAWDVEVYYQEKGWTVDDQVTHVSIHEETPNCVAIKREIQLSQSSTMTQIIRMYDHSPVLEFDCRVYWRENRRLLRAQVPLSIKHATSATFESQYGLVERPTHQNTTWDVAKFECCGQRFVNVSEQGLGVALMSDCKYGYSARSTESNITLGVSLLRAPKAPDLECDIGVHRFKYGIYAHDGEMRQVIKHAAIFNTPLVYRHVHTSPALMKPPIEPMFQVQPETLVLDMIKVAEDGEGVVLRFYEPVGSRGKCHIGIPLTFHQAYLCDGLEECLDKVAIQDGSIELSYLPFQLISLKLNL